MMIGIALFGLVGRAHAWSPVRRSYPDSIKPMAVAGPTGSAVRPAIVRPYLTQAEREAQMGFEVALRMRNFAELQGRIAHGDQISPAEMDAKYFPVQADYDRVVQWVRDQGFEVTRTDANKLAVFARGSVDATAAAFQVTFARVNFRGAEYTSAVTAPSLPAELAPMVLGIHGLQPHIRPHTFARPRPAINGYTAYLPSQILTAYGAGSMSQDGTGQTIAMIEAVFPLTSDITAFWMDANIVDSTSHIELVSVGNGPDTSAAPYYSDELSEASLDSEWASGIAPGAVIRIYGAGSSDPGSFDEAYQQIFSDLGANPAIHQLSLSFGNNEDDLPGDYFLIESQYMANLAAAGVTVFAASGDGGSRPDPMTGQYNQSARLQVEYPASDPSVTGVGGTHLELNGDNTIESETAWPSSGGGISSVYARPAWQVGANISAGPNRMVPDVAATADPALGALVVQQGQDQTIGGTSWATPVWAGLCALINQARGTPVGFLNPKLYPLQGTSAFLDIVEGGNSDYPAVPGYDMETGLGSPNASALASAIGDASGPLAIIAQLGDQFVTPGATATFAVVTYPPPQYLANPDNFGIQRQWRAAGTQAPVDLADSSAHGRSLTPMSIVVFGGNFPSFQWQRKAAGTQAWVDLADSSAYSGSLTPMLAVFGVTTEMLGDQFQCVVTDDGAVVTSNPAAITVGQTGVTDLAGWPGAEGVANGTGRAARFDFVGSLRLDGQGNLFVADSSNDTIRMVTPGGIVTRFAGTPKTAGFADGPRELAQFTGPGGVATDSSGNVYVADSGNYTVREISASGQVTTIAGSVGVQGTSDGTGTGAQFYDMQNLAADGLGNLYVVDGMADTVRKVVIATGQVTTLAGAPGKSGELDGTGGAARFNDPTGVTTDPSGNVYVSDTGNNTIRMITPTGQVSTKFRYLLSSPAGLCRDAMGNFFVANTGDFDIVEFSSEGAANVIAGVSGTEGEVDGPLLKAEFGFPVDIAVNSSGTIYVADGFNDDVRQIVPVAPLPIFSEQPVGQTMNSGSTLVLTAAAAGATSYQWYLDGSLVSISPYATTDIINDANSQQLVITKVTGLSAGNYTVVAVSPAGSSPASAPAAVSVVIAANPGSVGSISARAFVGTNDNILIGGFFVAGTTSRSVLIQALGPALAPPPYNIAAPLAKPVLSIHQARNGRDVVLYTNAGWGSNPVLLTSAAKLSALPVLQPGSADSELLVTLPPGGYTAEVASADGVGTGVALCAIYQLP